MFFVWCDSQGFYYIQVMKEYIKKLHYKVSLFCHCSFILFIFLITQFLNHNLNTFCNYFSLSDFGFILKYFFVLRMIGKRRLYMDLLHSLVYTAIALLVSLLRLKGLKKWIALVELPDFGKTFKNTPDEPVSL